MKEFCDTVMFIGVIGIIASALPYALYNYVLTEIDSDHMRGLISLFMSMLVIGSGLRMCDMIYEKFKEVEK